ncbi:MAG: hypothetical protein IJ639_06215, partial [Ruminococcus sp.]|nr:hypothetical protein [Ruminococcus sp.]
MNKTLRLTAIALALMMALSIFAGCVKTETETKAESSSELYFTQQDVRKSPEWVTKLDATKDAEQLIVVAGV